MSKLFENKQLFIHIATEMIVIVGVFFYFSQKHRKLLGNIEELSQRLEEQEEIIQKHDKLIQKLISQKKQHTFKVKDKVKDNKVIIPKNVVIVSQEHDEDDEDDNMDNELEEELKELEIDETEEKKEKEEQDEEDIEKINLQTN